MKARANGWWEKEPVFLGFDSPFQGAHSTAITALPIEILKLASALPLSLINSFKITCHVSRLPNVGENDSEKAAYL